MISIPVQRVPSDILRTAFPIGRIRSLTRNGAVTGAAYAIPPNTIGVLPLAMCGTDPFQPFVPRPNAMIYDSVLDLIGRTPIVRLTTLSDHLRVNVFVKLESFNPGGSHKVRVAHGMIADAEAKGILRPGSGQTIIEPTGGNTGVGLAMVANRRGYRLVAIVPDNYSADKQELLRLYGAEVVLSDSRNGNNSHGELVLKMMVDNPEYVLLNQQRNPANPETHRRTTALEILHDMKEVPPDYFVGGIGTGGHITGVGDVLTARWPEIKVFGVEPQECDMLGGRHSHHDIQGLSVGIIPDNLDVALLNGMLRVSRRECVDMALRVLRTESISIGISSAANLVAVSKLAADISDGATVLTMVYDALESYLPYFRTS